MVLVHLSPEMTEWVPAIAGLVAIASGWGYIFYVRHIRRLDRLRGEQRGAD